MCDYQTSGVCKTKRGFVLLEAILSVVILSVCLTVIIQSMSASMRATKMSSEYFQALFLIENAAAQLQQKQSLKEIAYQEEKINFGNKEYQLNYLNQPPLEEYQLEQVDVQLSWKTGGNLKKLSFPVCFIKEQEKAKDLGL